MDFNKKLQELRKQKGLTQEELAEILFVSRTAVSKWESGRGYPNIDSLKAISVFFGVTIDELLSGNELLTIAEEDTRQKENRFRDVVFGSLDCCTAMFFFLPFFGQERNAIIQSMPLLSLTEIASYLKITYVAVVIAMIASGVFVLSLRSFHNVFWEKNKSKLSLTVNMIGVLLFIVSSQPYAAAFLFVFLVMKSLLLIKWQ